MKVSLGIFWILVLITVFAHFGSSKIITKREESNYENGTDVVVVKPGPLDIILTEKNLTFEFCGDNCIEDFLFCYEPASRNQTAFLKLCDSKCGYYVNVNEDSVSFMRPFAKNDFGYPKANSCFTVSMMYKITNVLQNGEGVFSCDPKIKNGLVHLQIEKAGSGCPVTIKNAKLKRNEVSTPNSNENSPSNNNPDNAPLPGSSATTSKLIENYFGWFFVLFVSFYLLH